MSELARGHLVFACGASLYAVPAETAAEVVNLPALTRVPGAPAHLLGVFAHRGEVIPVVDLSRLSASATPDAFRRAVLMRLPAGSVALTATRVFGVAVLEGRFDALGTGGLQAHLKGPLTAPAGQVVAIEPAGFLEYLGQG
jgi:purine-binding chemotaxis protein CheW